MRPLGRTRTHPAAVLISTMAEKPSEARKSPRLGSPEPPYPSVKQQQLRTTTTTKRPVSVKNTPKVPSPLAAGTLSRVRGNSESASSPKHPVDLKLGLYESVSESDMDTSTDGKLSCSNTSLDVTSESDTRVRHKSQTQESDTRTPKIVTAKANLKKCPCDQTTGGEAWTLKCVSCTQIWHNSCANLKGKLSKPMLESIDMWQCPWCFTVPFAPPKSHKCRKNAQSLQNMVLCDAITSQLEDRIESIIEKKLKITSIEDTIRSSVEDQIKKSLQDRDQTQNDTNVKSTESQLKELTSAIESLKKSPPQSDPEMLPDLIESVDGEKPKHSIQPVKQSQEDFVDEDTAVRLSTYLDTLEFKKEGRREVIAFGEKYKYHGARNMSPKPMPQELQTLLNTLNEGLGYALNQCLVNKYTGKSSALPRHSDDEADIDPNSDIFTISLGSERTIKFQAKDTKAVVLELPVKHRSMYAMSRTSQDLFTHEIQQDTNLESSATRYSITFRRTHWSNFNSTLLYGDSNFGPIKMGDGKGKVGKATPGVRDFAGTVEEVNPIKCIAYQNVVCMFGTNNLKKKEEKSEEDIKKIYRIYKGKLEQIRQLNPRCKLLVCPVLPTTDPTINKKILIFNNFLYNDLQRSSLRINIVWGFAAFVGHNGLLKSSLHGEHWEGDPLHINLEGTRLLVRLIKQNIFSLRRPKGTSSNVDGRTYQAVLQGPPPNRGAGGQAGRRVNRMQAPSSAWGHS